MKIVAADADIFEGADDADVAGIGGDLVQDLGGRDRRVSAENFFAVPQNTKFAVECDMSVRSVKSHYRYLNLLSRNDYHPQEVVESIGDPK